MDRGVDVREASAVDVLKNEPVNERSRDVLAAAYNDRTVASGDGGSLQSV
jgi:hypothetical protein